MNSLFDKDTWQEIFGSISQNKIRTVITIKELIMVLKNSLKEFLLIACLFGRRIQAFLMPDLRLLEIGI